MATLPIQRKRFLGLPPWVLPALILTVAGTAWMVLADDDQPETDVIEAGPAYATVPDVPDETAAPAYVPPPRAAGLPPTAEPSTATEVATEAATRAATAAAVRAGTAAGAAAGAAASRAVLASVGDVGRTIRASAATVGALNGRPVRIADARVSGIVSDRAFYVGDGAERLMVVVDPPTETSLVRTGERVSLSGTLETFEARPGEPAGGGYVLVARPGAVAR